MYQRISLALANSRKVVDPEAVIMSGTTIFGFAAGIKAGADLDMSYPYYNALNVGVCASTGIIGGMLGLLSGLALTYGGVVIPAIASPFVVSAAYLKYRDYRAGRQITHE